MFHIDTPFAIAVVTGMRGSVIETTITPRDLSEYSDAARNGRLPLDIVSVSFRDIATGVESPDYVIEFGYCAHSHTAIDTYGDVSCEFCSALVRRVTAEEYRGMVE